MNATSQVDRIIDGAAEPLPLVTAKLLAMCDDDDEEDEDELFAFEIPVAVKIPVAVVIPVAVEVPVVSEMIPFAIEVPVRVRVRFPNATLGVKIGFFLYFCAAVVSVRQLLRPSVVTDLLLLL
uniref:Uncharacterized protein n=1 Tax=Chaetoceros debilis TaxID=122233 RepID=A0A7S3Q028_9STRA